MNVRITFPFLIAQILRERKKLNLILQKNSSWEYFKSYIDKRMKDTKSKRIYRKTSRTMQPSFISTKN